MGIWLDRAKFICILFGIIVQRGSNARSYDSSCQNECGSEANGVDVVQCQITYPFCSDLPLPQDGTKHKQQSGVTMAFDLQHDSATNQNTLAVTWTLKSLESVVDEVVVAMGTTPSSSSFSASSHTAVSTFTSSKICTLYSNIEYNNLSLSNSVTFHFCSSAITSGGTVLTLSLLTLPNNFVSEYEINVPSELDNLSTENVSYWQTPVAVTSDTDQKTVTVVIQPPPSSITIESFNITLIETSQDQEFICEEMRAGETSLTFTNVPRDHTYKILVVPISVLCVPISRCLPSESISFTLQLKLPTVNMATPVSTTRLAPTANTRAVPSSPSPPNDSPRDTGVIIQPADEQREYEESVRIILGTVFGVLSLAILFTVVFCLCRRRRTQRTRNFPMQRFGHGRSSDSSGMAESVFKQLPLVLLLYSYDCPVHERVLLAFANLLQSVANCEVLFDIWDQHYIRETGIHAWLRDKMDIAEFVVVVCSTGARFKCMRNNRFRMKHDRPTPDYFAWAVDYIAEKMRIAKQTGESMSRFLVVCFEYSSKSDIPPKLDTCKNFHLMSEFNPFYYHIHSLKPPNGVSVDDPDLEPSFMDLFTKTDAGQMLQAALAEAKDSYKNNPDWLGQILVPLTPVMSPAEVTAVQSELPKEKSTTEIPSEKDPLVEERRKKRLQEVEARIERVQMSPEDHTDAPVTTPGTLSSTSSSSPSSSSPLMQTPISTNQRPAKSSLVPADQFQFKPASQMSPQGRPISSSETSLHHVEIDVDLDDDDDFNEQDEEEQLRKDVDFIQNYDANHQHVYKPTNFMPEHSCMYTLLNNVPEPADLPPIKQSPIPKDVVLDLTSCISTTDSIANDLSPPSVAIATTHHTDFVNGSINSENLSERL